MNGVLQADTQTKTNADGLKVLIKALNCTDRQLDDKNLIEDKDSEHYKPVNKISAYIKTNEILSDGYDDGGIQNYYFVVEEYSKVEQAEKRGADFLGDEWRQRLSKDGAFKYDDLVKKSIRCFAQVSGKKVYLLSTDSEYADLVSDILQSLLIDHLDEVNAVEEDDKTE